MAIVYFAGFETGDLRELSTPGSNTVDTSIVFTGAYSMVIDPDTSGGGIASTGAIINSTTAFTRSHHRVDVTVNPSIQTDYLLLVVSTGAADILQIFLRITAAGVLSLVLKNGVGGAAIGSPFVISNNTWYTLETKTVISATVGILELKVNGAVVATGSSLNTGTTNITLLLLALYAPAFNSAAALHYIDDLITSDSAYIGEGGCIARQGKAGTPTYDAWSKVGAATAALCWSDTPFSAATNCTSATSGDAQTMLTESFSVVQAGHGAQVIDGNDIINAIKVSLIAKVALGSSQSIRRRIGGADTDTAKTLTTSDAYYDDGIWTASLANLNAAEIGMLHGANVNLVTAEDLWIMADFQSVPSGGGRLLPLLGVGN